MALCLETAGERLSFDCSLPWVAELIAEGAAGELREAGARDAPASVTVQVEADRSSFDTRGWEPLARGCWRREREVVVENAGTAGFDLHVRSTPESSDFTYRWRPPLRDRAVAQVLRSRFHLLARAMLIQYPALWTAGTRGRAPLHASACVAGAATPLLSAPSGIGRSTLLLRELDAGAAATGDNLAVGDGETVWGLVEPLRVEGGSGRRMPYGRNEAQMRNRAHALTPDSVIILRRDRSDQASLSTCSAESAARSLVTSTYMAGELRRYWPFAATLAAGTGVDPPHPPVAKVAAAFAASLPCLSLTLGRSGEVHLAELLGAQAVAA
jgi:hypothetical protein